MVERFRPGGVTRVFLDVPNSKYLCWHNAIIERARFRTREDLVYAEKHHVIPRCLKGTNAKSNLVFLTPEEHFVVHQLLVKIFPGNKSLINAVVIMVAGGRCPARNNKLYGWLKREYILSMQGNTRTLGATWVHSAETIQNFRAAHTPERREKARIRAMGNKFGLGNKSTKGRKFGPRPPETCLKLHNILLGNQHTKGLKLCPRSLEHTAKQRGSQLYTLEKRKPSFQYAGCLEGLIYG